jgi:hypothetical protein
MRRLIAGGDAAAVHDRSLSVGDIEPARDSDAVGGNQGDGLNLLR